MILRQRTAENMIACSICCHHGMCNVINLINKFQYTMADVNVNRDAGMLDCYEYGTNGTNGRIVVHGSTVVVRFYLQYGINKGSENYERVSRLSK